MLLIEAAAWMPGINLSGYCADIHMGISARAFSADCPGLQAFDGKTTSGISGEAVNGCLPGDIEEDWMRLCSGRCERERDLLWQ